jgi:hypothetical protein
MTTSVAPVSQGDFGSPSMWIWILSIYLVVAIYRIRQPLHIRNYDKLDFRHQVGGCVKLCQYCNTPKIYKIICNNSKNLNTLIWISQTFTPLDDFCARANVSRARLWGQGRSGLTLDRLRNQVRIMCKFEDVPVFILFYIRISHVTPTIPKNVRCHCIIES